MKILTEAEFGRQLSAPASGYLFFGDEDYTKLHATRRLRDAVCPDPSLATFNNVYFSALDFSPSRLVDALEPPPLLSDRKIITVAGLDLSTFRPDEIDSLCEALSVIADYDYNVVCLSLPAGSIDEGRLPGAPSGLLSRLGELLTPVHFPRITPSRLAGWVGKHFEHNGIVPDTALCSRVVDYCGTSMFTLSNEVDKLSFYALSQGRNTILPQDIEAVCIADTEYDTFAFANALTAGDRRRALDILSVMKLRRIEPTIIMGEVSRVFCDMLTVRTFMDEGLTPTDVAQATRIKEYPARRYFAALQKVSTDTLRHILDMCESADASVKSSRGYEAIERFICGL